MLQPWLDGRPGILSDWVEILAPEKMQEVWREPQVKMFYFLKNLERYRPAVCIKFDTVHPNPIVSTVVFKATAPRHLSPHIY